MKKHFIVLFVLFCISFLLFVKPNTVKAAETDQFPFVSLDYYTITKEKIIPGSDFTLTLSLRNNSETATAHNVVVNVTCPTGVRSKYGTPGQVYIKEIPKGETAEVSLEFSTIEEIYTYYLDFQVSILADESNNTLSLRVPVGTDSPFNLTNIVVDETGIEGGTASGSVSFKVIGIDYVKDVVLIAYFDGTEVNSISIGSLAPGTSKSQLISVPLYSSGEHEISFAISYEDGTGKSGKMEIEPKPISVDRRVLEPTQPPEEKQSGVLDRLKSNTKMFAGIAGVIGVIGLSVLVFFLSKKGKR